MKILKLDISLKGLKLSEEDMESTPLELAISVVKNVILLYGSQQRGLAEDERRKFYKICDVFDKAVEAQELEIQLDDDWYGFMRKCFKEAKLVPDNLLRRVEEIILKKDE